MTGPIRRLAFDHVERRDNVQLPSAWIGGASSPGTVAGLSWLQHAERSEPSVVDKDSPVLVMLTSESSPAFTDLLAHGESGARVYVLVPSEWGKGVVDERLLACSKILIRRIPEVPATGVHCINGTKLWLGRMASDLSPWRLRLDSSQAESFRQVFLRLFWHEAIEETWTSGQKLSFRVAGERPFDVPGLPHSAPIRLLPPNARLDADIKCDLLHIANSPPPQTTLRRLWINASGEHHSQLSHLARAGAQVVWEDQNLPDLAFGEHESIALLPGIRARLSIKLTQEQAKDVKLILEKPAVWNFHTDVCLGDHVYGDDRLWLANETAARPVETEQVLHVADVQADSLRNVFTSTPGVWPAAQPLALAVRYRWTVIPPRLPAGAEEDALAGRWRKIDEDWKTQLDRLRETLQSTEGDRGRIGKSFTRLVSAMLGFERKQSALLAEVTSMQSKRPSADGPASAPAMLSRLVEIEEQIRMLQGDLKETESKAREDEEREKQETAWRSRVGLASRALPLRRMELADAEGRLSTTASELASIDETLKTEEVAANKDHKARRQKLSDELIKLEKTINHIRGEVDGLGQQAAERFEFKPPATPTMRPSHQEKRFVPSNSTTRTSAFAPDEALPAVGALRRQQGQRYLVIEKWEDLNLGEQEAVRLNAKLVAPENS